MDCVNLPAQFAAMPLDLFLATYGNLGRLYANDVDENRAWKEDTKAERDDLIEEQGLSAIWAEPVEWIEAHRAGVSWCLRAGAVLSMPSETRRESNERDQRCDEIRLALPLEMGFGNTISVSLSAGSKFDPVKRLGKTLEFALIRNLGGVRRWPEFRDGGLRTTWGAMALIDMIYSLLADALTGERLRICEHCAKPFVQTDLRQRFCPPLRVGAKSTCMNTALVRRKRATAALRAKAGTKKKGIEREAARSKHGK